MKKYLLILVLFVILPGSYAAKTIFEHNNFGYNNVYFSGYTCNIDNSEACPYEMGWKGRQINAKFTLTADELIWPKLRFRFNVPYKNWAISENVRLKVSAGTNPNSLTVVNSSVEISYLGGYDIIIDTSLFSPGSNNYIQLYGVNVQPVGYGQNPPNCQFNYFDLSGYGVGPPPAITDLDLLDQTEAYGARYFLDHTLSNGLVKDTSSTPWASIAATGFGLALYPVMIERYNSSQYWTYYTPEEVIDQTNKILDTLLYIQQQQPVSQTNYGKEGLFYHFILADSTNANSEVSTVDTAILMAGAITAAEYFGGDIKVKVHTLLDNMNWNYFYNSNKNQFSHGWMGSLISQTWDRPSDETILVTLIAMASQPEIDFAESFFSWPRVTHSYGNYSLVNSYFGSMFTYFFAHIWYDFEDFGYDNPSKVDGSIYTTPVDWWNNSVKASLASRQFSIDNVVTYTSYGENSWGLTPCQKPDSSYEGRYGAKPTEFNSGNAFHDGTIAPYGAISTMPFFSETLQDNLAFKALRHYYDSYYWDLWGDYGPKDSFDETSFSTVYLGIDVGPQTLMIENYRTNLIINTFMKNQRVRNAVSEVFDYEPYIFSINLTQGWNLISIPLLLKNHTLPIPLTSIEGNYSVLYAYLDNVWYQYPAGELPTNKDMDLCRGFWINMTNPDVLEIEGYSAEDIGCEINLGWNLLGNPHLVERSIHDAVLDEDNVTAVYEYNGTWSSFIPDRPSNSLQIIKPGFGYWVNVE